MFSTKISHEFALKRFARHLKNNQDRDLVLDPSSDIFKVDAYSDAGFAGMYWQKRHDDPTCANIFTGFIITFYACPVLWISKFQTETSLSTMES